MRIIIYTGKGGVGKTSIAAASAHQLAAEGKRVIVLSTDAAHSLSDSFGLALTNEPTQVTDTLWAHEIDSLKETERHWGSITRWFSEFMQWAKLDDIGTEELMIFPGFEELFSLLKIKEHVESRKYDVIIVDCAPTGETLRLLSYPNLLKWWVQNIFPYERKLLKVARPIVKLTKGLDLPDDTTMDSLGQVVWELEELQKIVMDSTVTSIRMVLNPEKMVISEAKRALTHLNLYGFHTDAIIVNKVLPIEASEGYLSQWQKIHSEYEKEIEEHFRPLPILKAPLMDQEVIGKEMLVRLAEAAFSDRRCGAILYHGKVEEIKRTDTGFTLSIALPFVKKDQVKLNQRGEELTLQVGSYRRVITLPRILLNQQVQSAKFADGQLTICFIQQEEEQDGLATDREI
ncbi:ArsA family ATPase [Sporosarcina sp. Te-1]|uniref:ArsA family ATPase n=1 Tax=Sporosarcina sp. Te-1 TaxID=2818390 RepID=UPI001A9D4A77|nr:ArsA family ATPase [Sporosarcina sp. Te-1]QTD39533.1 ArsA family ATPase [Sporosarcina sp. Te-1]